MSDLLKGLVAGQFY